MKNSNSTEPSYRKILVRVPRWLGDAVAATVFIGFVKKRFPDASISVLSAESLVPLFESNPEISRVLTYNYAKHSIFSLAKALKKESFDAVFILPRSWRSAFEAWLAGIPQRIGYAGDLRRLLLTQAVSYDRHLRHSRRYLRLLGDHSADLSQVKPYFPSKAPSPDFLSNLGMNSTTLKSPVLGIGPLSIAPARTWEKNRFIDVANHFLESTGGSVILFGSKPERDEITQMASSIKGAVINTAGRLDFPALGWFVSQCHLFLCNDSGLMHVTSAFNVPTLVVLGSSDPDFALPAWGRFHSIYYKTVPCQPCARNVCVRFGDHYLECFKMISSDEVSNELERLSAIYAR